MCDTYVDSVGYVCFECQSEFKDYLMFKGKNPETDGAICRELEIFMETDKNSFEQGSKMNIDNFFDSYTK